MERNKFVLKYAYNYFYSINKKDSDWSKLYERTTKDWERIKNFIVNKSTSFGFDDWEDSTNDKSGLTYLVEKLEVRSQLQNCGEIIKVDDGIQYTLNVYELNSFLKFIFAK